MRIFSKILIYLILVILFISVIFTNSPVKAQNDNHNSKQNDFMTSYEVSYDVSETGLTSVTQKVNLRNLTSQFYASNFTLIIGPTEISNVTATDSSGPLEVKTDQSDNRTSITVNLNQQIAGIGKVQSFSIKYQSNDYAEKIGKTWAVNLPKIPDTSDIEIYNLSLSVPTSFGEPSSISPQPKSQTVSYQRIFLTFTKEKLRTSGVSVTYGDHQVFAFNIKYPLKNDSLFAVITPVVLPPDTPFQDVLISQISPLPQNVTIDPDGNYLAWFRLERRTSINVDINGLVKLYIKDKKDLSLNNTKLNLISITAEEKKALTKSDRYWEKDNPIIIATLEEVFKNNPPQTTHQKTQLIYEYVVNHLKYSNLRAVSAEKERLGAVTVLNNPENAVCMEFTDLFVALARAANIPAREIDGFAYSSNTKLRPQSLQKNLLHAWPEYFDEDIGWIMVDPTWENTSGGVNYFDKFDLSHVTLAIKGFSSVQPTVSDNLTVTLSEQDFLPNPKNNFTINIPDNLISGYPVTSYIKVSNLGNTLSSPITATISSAKLLLIGQPTINFGPIPPFGSATYNFKLKTSSIWENNEQNIVVNIGGQQYSHNLNVKPFFLIQPFPSVFILIIILMVSIYLGLISYHLIKKRPLKAR